MSSYVLAIVMTSVIIKSHYDNFSGSIANVKNAYNGHSKQYIECNLLSTVYFSIL